MPGPYLIDTTYSGGQTNPYSSPDLGHVKLMKRPEEKLYPDNKTSCQHKERAVLTGQPLVIQTIKRLEKLERKNTHDAGEVHQAIITGGGEEVNVGTVLNRSCCIKSEVLVKVESRTNAEPGRSL